jgi:hypothetical protein
MSLMPFPPVLGLETRAKVGFMGHNKGRDTVTKRAKRRKKHERLASAKQPSRKAAALQEGADEISAASAKSVAID